MNYMKMFQGDYIAAVDFDGKRPTLTIKSVELVDLEDDRGKTSKKGVIYFRETEKGLIVNKTNAILMAGMWGPETDDWVGHRLTLHAVQVQFGRERVLGVRVLGSPDLERPISVSVKLPKKRAVDVELIPTGDRHAQ